MQNLTILDKACLVLAILLLVCLAPMPYGYYTVVRFITAIIMACVAYVHFREEKPAIGIAAAAVAILFQPFIRLALDRLTWNVLDVALAIVLVVWVLLYKKK